MRFAIIDLGTNTFNLLVAAPSQPVLASSVAARPAAHTSGVARTDSLGLNKQISLIHSEELPVFLGRGGIEKGMITEDAFARGIDALRSLKAIALEHGAERITGFGTSALRNACNGKEFVAQAKSELDLDITIIPGEEEAALILDGVRQAVTFTAKPRLVMDIGGGSIEFILATDKALMWKRSFEIGVTRLRDRLSPSDPITIEEHFRIAAHLDAQLEPLWAVMERHWPIALVGSAGSFDTLALIIANERGRTIDGNDRTLALSNTEFDVLKDRLLEMPRAERLCVPGLPEHRVDTIALALIAIERVMLHGIEEIRWSRYALKEGAALRITATDHL